MIGQTVSHYKILEKLGEGGMGVVYKAEDTKLHRPVALKVLPRQALISEEDKTRFAREAQAAASLSHPNIAIIHEFDEVDDSVTGSKLAFIAMEYVDGKTLKEKIEERPLPIKEAVNVALAVAEGLAEAHRKGITHRDIKTENVMISREEHVKIMDFGLAAIPGRSRVTKAGTTLGTAAYMSPEQTQGEKLDQRTDIWSLGVVLYEMVTGRVPFPGDYQQAIVYQILNQEPEPITSLRSNIPMELERIVRKAMQKAPEDRYQHVDEMLVDLRSVSKELQSTATRKIPVDARLSQVGLLTPEISQVKARSWQMRFPWMLFSIFFFVTSVALAVLYFRREPGDRGTLRATVLPPSNSTIADNLGGNLSISPNGLNLAFVATDPVNSSVNRLWVRSLNAISAQPLAGTDGAYSPFWSPDSRYIGFFSGGKLQKISAVGGPVATICDAPSGRGATWGQAGMIVFSPSPSGGLYKVPAEGGTPTAVTVLDTTYQEITHRWPHFLPDGKHFFYFGYSVPGNRGNAICIASLDSRETKRLLPGQSNMVYADGYLLYFSQTRLMAQSFDEKKLELVGEAIPIVENVRYNVAYARADFSASQTGTLIYRGGGTQSVLELLVLDRSGNPIQTLGEPLVYSGASVSPDGKRIALDLFDLESRNRDIWLYDMLLKTRTRFTFDESVDMAPIWSPDGSTIVFSSNRKGRNDLYQKNAQGTTYEQVLLESMDEKRAFDWSDDGKFITYNTISGPRGSRDIWVVPLTGDRKPSPFLQTEFDEWGSQFSPDSRWIAYVSDESGRNEVYVRPFPGPGGKWRISSDGGFDPHWQRDGKELFFLNLSSPLITVAEVDIKGPEFKLISVKPLFNMPRREVSTLLDIFPDGQRFLVASSLPQQAPEPITLVTNWARELKQK